MSTALPARFRASEKPWLAVRLPATYAATQQRHCPSSERQTGFVAVRIES